MLQKYVSLIVHSSTIVGHRLYSGRFYSPDVCLSRIACIVPRVEDIKMAPCMSRVEKREHVVGGWHTKYRKKAISNGLFQF